jgi:hypothetical protein
VQEGHQFKVLTPTSVGFGGFNDLTLGQSFCLHLQVDLCINVGGVERDVSEPCTDSINVHPGPKQVCGRGMPNRVRAHSLRAQRGHGDLELIHVALDKCVDAKTR